MSVVVIGDIHGGVDLVKALLDKIEHYWQWETIVFLGDYIDHGSHSFQVITLLEGMAKEMSSSAGFSQRRSRTIPVPFPKGWVLIL